MRNTQKDAIENLRTKILLFLQFSIASFRRDGLHMKGIIEEFRYFFVEITKILFKGNRYFYLWMAILTILVIIGLYAYIIQLKSGMVVTNMRDQVSWGFYIANFTFLVGIAAAAVLLVIPAYLYRFNPIKKVVIFGELLAITALVMAITFILVDIGRLERVWHMMPFIGKMNFPRSMLAWDMIVLNSYLFLNLFISTYMGCHTYFGKKPSKRLVILLILISIPLAISVHTVTAFVYNSLVSRPFWDASILAPRFLASAFCSGPALMILIFQVLRRLTDFRISDRAILKLAEIVTYAMAINLFLLFVEVFKVFTATGIHHLLPMKYLYQGLHGHNNLVPWIWTALVFNLAGFLLFLIPRTRKRLLTINAGCLLIFAGIWIEKGMGMVIPGFVPDTLGEIYEYIPSIYEVLITVGIFSGGAMLYTLLVRAAIAVETGRLRHPLAPPIPKEEEDGIFARDIMTEKVLTAGLDTPAMEIARLLIENRISGLPVVDEDNRVLGVVSESDIIFREIHREPHILERLGEIVLPEERRREKLGEKASDIMTSPAITAYEDTPLNELVQTITEKKIKRIIIVNQEGRLRGIVSRIDIVKAIEKITRKTISL